ncbi:hypothetical protein H9W95_07425 [Flavobacterium lindanitolerans]|nr:hypothetical protein [Flavobacterium lindanitolerans]
MKDFIKDFNPDVIYSPSYDSFYMHDILKFVQKESSVKVVYFHCDDLVTYRQYSGRLCIGSTDMFFGNTWTKVYGWQLKTIASLMNNPEFIKNL